MKKISAISLVSLFTVCISFKLSSYHFSSSFENLSLRRKDVLLLWDSRFISDVTKERIKNGKITMKELDKIYEPTKNELESAQHPIAKGFAAVIVSLEGVMVNVDSAVGYSWAALAADLGFAPPSAREIKDIVGLDFEASILALGWNLPNEVSQYSKRFYEILKFMIERIPFQPMDGVFELLENVIRDGNRISVVTTFPRDIATTILRKTQLAKIFEDHNINPENLVDLEVTQSSSSITSGYTTFGRLLTRCCAVMEKSTLLTLFIASNHRNILISKRMGISSIALKGGIPM